MKIRRREFFTTAAVASAGLMAGNRVAAQDSPARGAGAKPAPTYAPKIEMLWKSPDRYPNALETSPEGLWVGDQVSERINLLDDAQIQNDLNQYCVALSIKPIA